MSAMGRILQVALLISVGTIGCGDSDNPVVDAAVEDAPADGPRGDGPATDARPLDAATADAPVDAHPSDAAPIDAALVPCDDGNTMGGDGCSASHFVEPGWWCTGSPSICSGEMALVPAGDFVMGSDPIAGHPDEQPKHVVTLSAFEIDRHEVTNREYRLCEAAGGCTAPASLDSHSRVGYHTTPAYDDYPVISVNWVQASSYCAWAGKRLPTEAEWEKGARGGCEVVMPITCGSEDERTYPWGETPPTCSLANYYSASYCVEDTDAVGARPAGDSPYGAHNMAGNAQEWVADWYSSDYSWCSGGCSDPTGPATGSARALRGGRWNSYVLRVAARDGGVASYASDWIGFRCARTP
jgi:formylglycine-generating enzyme required for sulfatase activity